MRSMIDGLADLMDGLPDPVIIIGSDLRILHANASAEEQFGTGLANESFFAVTRQPEALECIRKAHLHGAGTEARVKLSTGEIESIFRFTASPLKLTGMNFCGLLISLTDVSQVDDAEQIRKEFIANASHELRSPLTTLSGFIETLKGEAGDDAGTRTRFLSIMENEAVRMESLVGDLLSLSKLEADERIRPTGTVDVFNLVRDTISALRPVASRYNASIRLGAEEVGLLVSGDQSQLSQVFHNLIENALKYGREQGTVQVNCFTHPGEVGHPEPAVRVDVVDQGDGIDAIHLPRLTERFYRVDKHRSRAIGGTGLGLAIVKHIVNRHRGRLAISSEVGVGSTFSVFLPLQAHSPNA